MSLVHDQSIMTMGSIVLALLVGTSLMTWVLQLKNPDGQFKELSQRIQSWWWMAGFFFFSMIIHPDAALILFALLSFFALKEYFTLIQTRLEDHRAIFWSFLAILIQYWFIYSHWWPMVILFIPLYMYLGVGFRLILTGKTKGFVDASARIHWGLMACVFCISHLAYLLKMPVSPELPGGGRALVLYLVFLTEMNDVAQYTFGKLFGKNPIAPSVSPKKTQEGFLGGLLTTLILSVLLRFLTGFDLPTALATGALIACSGFIGDLVMSAVKRDVGVKDASHLIPGHGGMLDRIDSLSYSAPLFFHFVNYFFHIHWP